MEQLDNLLALINQVGLKVGNRILAATGLVNNTSITQLYSDANSNLTADNRIIAEQPTKTLEFLRLSATPGKDVLTNTIVQGADVTTATIAGYARMALVSGVDGVVSTSAYYVPFYTIV